MITKVELTREYVENQISKSAKEVCTVGGASSVLWLGIVVMFEINLKSKGGDSKRGNTWGNIKYYDWITRSENNNWRGNELTREQAINEILKPMELRKAVVNAFKFRTCSLCGLIEVGNDDFSYRSEWERVSKIFYKKGNIGKYPFQEEVSRIKLDFCPECLIAIAKKTIAYRLFGVDL